jgi:hypothetical protein
MHHIANGTYGKSILSYKAIAAKDAGAGKEDSQGSDQDRETDQ